MKRTVQLLTWISAGMVLAGFFLPWANLQVRESKLLGKLGKITQSQEVASVLGSGIRKITATIRRGSETISADLSDLSSVPKHVSGFQIPRLANQDNAKVALALMEMVTDQKQHIGLKSYLVYLLPLIALISAGLLTMKSDQRWIVLGVGMLCAVVFGIGSWKVMTIDPNTLLVVVTIGQGLWFSLAGYLGLSVCSIAHFYRQLTLR